MKGKLGLTRKEYADTLDEILLKRTRGEKLSRRDERIYAYRNVGRCDCGVRRD